MAAQEIQELKITGRGMHRNWNWQRGRPLITFPESIFPEKNDVEEKVEIHRLDIDNEIIFIVKAKLKPKSETGSD
jgi:hypothetical protein